MTNPLFIDLETRSAEDLRRSGGRRYAEHPTTRLLTAAWIFHGERHVWIPTEAVVPQGFIRLHLPDAHVHLGLTPPEELDTTVPWVAHNAWEFDELVFRRLYPHHQPIEWFDSANLARQNGWPGRLDAIGKLIRGEGKQKVKKAWFDASKKEPGVGDLILIAKYNLDDVEIMEQLWQQLPPDQEPEVQWAHRRINDRGVRIDIPLLMKLRDLSVRATGKAVAECARLSSNAFTTIESLRKRDDMFAWLGKNGCDITSLDKKAIEAWVDEDGEGDVDVPEEVIPFLRSRMEALRITSGKLDAALSSIANGRIDGILNYCGAGTTRRWSSRRIQIHNLPRPSEDLNTWELLDNIDSLNPDAKTVSALLRFIFLPNDGDVIAACDYNAVESRGLAWLAGEERMLREYRAGKSPYDSMCARIFGEPPTSKKDPRRQIAKVTVLACGYQLSAGKTEEQGFRNYCRMHGVDLAAAGTTAEKCVYGFREMYPAIVDHWDMMNYAAVKCVRTGDRQRVRKVEFRFDGGNLYLYLPSGGRLTFRRAKLTKNNWGHDSVTYWDHKGWWDYLHGGKLTGLETQGSMRDLLAEASVRVERAGIPVLFHVHDEIVASVKDRGQAETFANLMVQLPDWAKGLPLEAECDVLERYAKSARNKSSSFTVRA